MARGIVLAVGLDFDHPGGETGITISPNEDLAEKIARNVRGGA